MCTQTLLHFTVKKNELKKLKTFSFQLKMVLIKCCDISNEVRPTEVAEPWVDCLLEEYFMQVTECVTGQPGES